MRYVNDFSIKLKKKRKKIIHRRVDGSKGEDLSNFLFHSDHRPGLVRSPSRPPAPDLKPPLVLSEVTNPQLCPAVLGCGLRFIPGPPAPGEEGICLPALIRPLSHASAIMTAALTVSQMGLRWVGDHGEVLGGSPMGGRGGKGRRPGSYVDCSNEGNQGPKQSPDCPQSQQDWLSPFPKVS